jgi:SAM-dependent methyltransferase
MGEVPIFLSCLERHASRLKPAARVLELGAGQGWASCVYKRRFTDSHVTATDISEYAIASLPKWEHVFQVKVDRHYACRSYETNEADAAVDHVFCFAAAHHFVAHRKTLREISRVLKPGGSAFYFYEPTTPRYLYSIAHRRVNRNRPAAPEDVLITREIVEIATSFGLGVEVDYFPSLPRRGSFESVYYAVLGKLPTLWRLLPCTANFIFRK